MVGFENSGGGDHGRRRKKNDSQKGPNQDEDLLLGVLASRSNDDHDGDEFDMGGVAIH